MTSGVASPSCLTVSRSILRDRETKTISCDVLAAVSCGTGLLDDSADGGGNCPELDSSAFVEPESPNFGVERIMGVFWPLLGVLVRTDSTDLERTGDAGRLD